MIFVQLKSVQMSGRYKRRSAGPKNAFGSRGKSRSPMGRPLLSEREKYSSLFRHSDLDFRERERYIIIHKHSLTNELCASNAEELKALQARLWKNRKERNPDLC